jgi:hypothetical protein
MQRLHIARMDKTGPSGQTPSTPRNSTPVSDSMTKSRKELTSPLTVPQMSGHICSLELCTVNTLNGINGLKNFRPFCPVKLNGVATYALVDSGNLVINAISDRFARRVFGAELDSNLIPVTAQIGTAKKGEDGILDIMGMIRTPMTLRFGGTSITYKTRPIVIRGFNSDLNIARHFLAKHGIDQLHSISCL